MLRRTALVFCVSLFLTGCPESLVQPVDSPTAEPSASAEPTPEATTDPTPMPVASATPVPDSTSIPITPAPTSNPGAQGEASVQLPDGSQLRVTLPNRFLSGRGQSVQLDIRLIDANGNEVDLGNNRITFSSSRPQDFSINEDGLVIALQDNGFSRLTARIEGTDLEATQLISVASTIVGGTSSSSNFATSTPTPPPASTVNVNVELEGLNTRRDDR